MVKVIQVCIPQTGQAFYDYLPPSAVVTLGARVRVSFRRQERVGLVVGFSDTSLFQDKLKPILAVLDNVPVISEMMLAFYEWVATYYHASLSDVLHLSLPKQFREGRALNASVFPHLNTQAVPPVLHQEQQAAVNAICQSLGTCQRFMLQGVTGSGKTEVYLRVIEQVLASGDQVLVLVPEIGLTPQLVERFQSRLAYPIVVMHSHLNDTERYQAWCAAAMQQASLVIGTRSALFTPLPKLGLIVIDEEHDLSFKQQDGVRYSARDCALIRAKLARVPVVLGTATPSLETYHNIQLDKYKRLSLTRKAMASMPLHYELVDLRLQPMLEGLAPRSYAKIESHLAAGYQVLVFVNRRGFAPVLLCHACGWSADCPACERHYTVHQKIQTLMCHHCGKQAPLMHHCLNCKSTELISCGVGTQRLYQVLAKRFPNVSIAQIDRDELRKKHALEEALAAISSGETQLMVGTQLLAKGHHFPRLTLVVIVDADSALYHPDFRALERLGQLLLQVSGRAGRAEHQGEVLIQTHMPDHPMLNMLIKQGYDAFAQALLAQRQAALLPPYMHIGLIRAKGRISQQVEGFLHDLKKRLSKASVRVYGPAPSIMPKKANLYRMQLCLMSAKRQDLHDMLQQLKSIPMKGLGVKWSIDVDPVELS